MPTIKCYTALQPIRPFSFYVLCKGLNSGKPLVSPCPNCFVITCSDDSEKDFYFTLAYGLWKAKSFQYFLTGSVIVFLRIDDFKNLLLEHGARLQKSDIGFQQAVSQARLIESKEQQIRDQLKLLQELKIAIIRKHL